MISRFSQNKSDHVQGTDTQSDYIISNSIQTYNITTIGVESMPPKWDDDFEFENVDEKPKKGTESKKKPIHQDDDFFDLDDIEDKPKNKLPVINNKREFVPGSLQSKDKNSHNNGINSQKNNHKEQVAYGGIENDDSDYEVPKDKQTSKSKKAQRNGTGSKNKNSYLQSPPQRKDSQQAEEFFEEIQDTKFEQQVPSSKKNAAKKASQQSIQKQQNYGEDDFEEENYGQDFDEVDKIEKNMQRSPITKKPVEAPRVNKQVRMPIKPPSRKQSERNARDQSRKPDRNLSINKPLLPRNDSRKSLRSGVSRGKSTNAFIPNKYVNLVQKSFPQTIDPSKQSQQKLNKVNEKIRGMLKNFNQELNDIINKNMLYLKGKKNEKVVTVQDRIRVMEEEIKNNQTNIYRMDAEGEKLRGREGELKEEEYQLIIQKNVLEIQDKIKETHKQIHQLKVEVNNSGNKLSKKGDDKKISQELQNVKASLVQAKKDDEKGTQKIQKLDEKIQQLRAKTNQLENDIRQKIESAKSQGIEITNNQQVIKKYDQLKKKYETSKHYSSKLENLMKTKADIVSHQNEQLRIGIANCESEIKNLYTSISHSHEESVKVVEKAKQNPKIVNSVHGSLDQILRSLEQSVNDEARSEASRAESSRPFKKGPNSAVGNRQKSTPGKITQKPEHSNNNSNNNSKPPLSHQNVVQSSQISKDNKKPNFTRKKEQNEISIDKKNEERVWREQVQKSKETNRKQNNEPFIKLEEKNEEDKKKPFSLKRNRVGTQQKIENESNVSLERKDEQPRQAEAEKPKEEISVMGPRMMKFKKRNQQESSKEIQQKPLTFNQKVNVPDPHFKIPDKQQQTQEQNKPLFAPKRLNLRARNKQQKNDDSYLPSTVQKTKQLEPVIVPKKDQQYKPNFNFKQEQFKIDAVGNKKDNIKIEDHSAEGALSKPVFNLKLRDRKKGNEENGNDEGGYMPSVVSGKNLGKEQIGIKEEENAGGYVPIRVRNNANSPYSIPKENSSNNLASNKEITNPFKDKQQVKIHLQNNNPYAPPKEQFKNPYAPKDDAKNPYAPKLPKQKPVYPTMQQQQTKNPYVPSENQPMRQRQGRVKKQKINSNIPKEKFNIYEQAQDLTGGNEFVNKDEQPIPTYSQVQAKKEEDLDLNAMLGISKKKQNNDIDDLIGGNKYENKREKKRVDDFFGDMDI